MITNKSVIYHKAGFPDLPAALPERSRCAIVQ